MGEREDCERMVRTQIVARGVRDARVLQAMREVPRHCFIPEHLRDWAYDDRPLAIGDGQTISQPYMVAVMTELLSVEPHHTVLEVGTGSGYQTAILSRLAARVITVERVERLAEAARLLLASLGCGNVDVLVGDGTEGVPSEAPFDRILVTAGAPSVPDPLQSQLAEGGRLVVPVGSAGFQRLAIVDRTGDQFDTRDGEACVFVPLLGRYGWPTP